MAVIATIAGAGFAATAVAAESVADFYNGKTVTVIVAAAAGGNHSVYTQLLAPFWKKYTPGHPNFIINNMGGAGGTRAANYLYNAAPQDGSYLAILLSDTPLAARFQATGVKYDPSKFQYLGGADYTHSMITVLTKTGVKSIDDAKKTVLNCGSSGKASQTYYIPMLSNYFLGTKFKVILGYRGMNPVDAAMDRGETNCRAGVYSSIVSLRPQWITDHIVTQIASADLERHPLYPKVPTLIELAKTQQAKDVLSIFLSGGVLGRGWLAPPKTPKDRVTALREAFWKSFNDSDLRAKAKERHLHLEPVRWEKQQEAVEKIMKAPESVFDIAQKALGVKG
ncbi:MAG TPA: tripartite tricarboxylate transporter substrate-binding protein [Acetobacteraceae bacterium]|nr:tripartite tricarboxylate transporter substrate-binding protein [Acetobacteraceae bacterium]